MMNNSNTTFVKVKSSHFKFFNNFIFIQIQHLLKLNIYNTFSFTQTSSIQIQHLLKLNNNEVERSKKYDVIQIQHLLKLN